MNPSRLAIALLLTVLMLGACAPQAQQAEADSAAARETETVATIAHHRMEIGRLQTGEYTTNVLVDLDIPRGVRWTVLEFSGDAYVLRFTHDDAPAYAWLVDPSGVRVTAAPD